MLEADLDEPGTFSILVLRSSAILFVYVYAPSEEIVRETGPDIVTKCWFRSTQLHISRKPRNHFVNCSKCLVCGVNLKALCEILNFVSIISSFIPVLWIFLHNGVSIRVLIPIFCTSNIPTYPFFTPFVRIKQCTSQQSTCRTWEFDVFLKG